MDTLTELRQVVRRLVTVGWDEGLRKHELDLQAALARDDKGFAEALAAELAVDRSVPGFIDFTTAGNRAIEPGKPAASLLYHAMASPFVHPDGTDTPGNASQYPTLAELDAVENYIFGLQQVDLSKLRNPVIAVLAYEYRTAPRSPHGQHADLAYSRCGVARVGTAAAAYDAINRGFAGSDEHGAIRAVPARYAAFVAEHVKPDDRRVKPDKHVAIMARQRADQWRDFALPVHKLFPGSDCLADTDLSIGFNEFHRNEKLARVHRNGGIRLVDGFDVDIYPFVRNSENAGDLVCLKPEGASVAVVPIPQDTLVRTAEQFNNRKRPDGNRPLSRAARYQIEPLLHLAAAALRGRAGRGTRPNTSTSATRWNATKMCCASWTLTHTARQRLRRSPCATAATRPRISSTIAATAVSQHGCKRPAAAALVRPAGLLSGDGTGLPADVRPDRDHRFGLAVRRATANTSSVRAARIRCAKGGGRQT